MKVLSVFVLIIISSLIGMVPATSEAADQVNSVNIGFGGYPRLLANCDANVLFMEYEHMLSGSSFAVLGRAGGINYRFDNGRYRETGDPKGVDVGARYYFDGRMDGFFISGSVGLWTGDWRFTDNRNTPLEQQGTASTDSVRFNLDVGARLPLGSSPVAIMPTLNIGVFKPSTTCEYTAPASLVGMPCNRQTEVRGSAFFALMAGLSF